MVNKDDAYYMEQAILEINVIIEYTKNLSFDEFMLDIKTIDAIMFNLQQMIEKIKMETRRYAKRQLTWFRKNKQTIWLDGSKDRQNNVDIILEGIN